MWMAARCSNPSKHVTCGESFCFKCLSQKYPQLYGSIFKGLWWLCPVCMGMCKCGTCSDPVKKAEYQRIARRKLKQRQKLLPAEDTKSKLRSGSHNKAARPPETPPVHVEEPADNLWICSRCSIVNSLDDIECIACGGHRKRNTRKRAAPESLHEDKFHTYKETRRATENNEDKSIPPAK